MRLARSVAILLLLCPVVTRAQETHKPEEWQKLYEDASAQLRAAQDRKAQLSNENVLLANQVKDLQRQLQQVTAQNKALRIATGEFDERVHFLNTSYLLWQAFLRNNALIRVQWNAFLGDLLPLEPAGGYWFCDPQWPFSTLQTEGN